LLQVDEQAADDEFGHEGSSVSGWIGGVSAAAGSTAGG
jgi:hypothetical protein